MIADRQPIDSRSRLLSRGPIAAAVAWPNSDYWRVSAQRKRVDN